MAQYQSATSKAEATARAYLLAGWEVEPLGPGSKEKKSALVALGAAVGLDLTDVAGKVECGRLVAAEVGVPWDDECFSRGDTVTLTGLNRLIDAVTRRLLNGAGGLDARAFHELTIAAAIAAASMRNKESSSMTEALSEVEQNIAERLAELSIPGPAVPEGVEAPTTRARFDDIGFADGSWRVHVAAVQGWLHLLHQLDSSDGPAFDASLAAALGLDHASLGRHDTTLLERLSERLERAIALREQFYEQMERAHEGAATLTSATQAWIAAWEEVEDEEEAEVGGPIDAAADTWPIAQFVQRAVTGKLNLSPSYQRADVWPTSDAQLLIESVVRGIPLPSVIVLQTQDEERRISFEVVDGKQRLTSILRFIGQHPRAIEIVKGKAVEWGVPDLLETYRTDYPAFKKLWKKHEQTSLNAALERQSFFPFPLRAGDNVKSLSGDLAKLRGKYYCQIRDEYVDIVGERWDLAYVFEQQADYRIPVIVYKQVTTEQVHEVFSLYNKQGKHLNAEEIRNALFHNLALMRALLVTAGDADDVATVAPFLQDDWDDLSSTKSALEGYDFGRAGYKRTKLLSWVAAVLFGARGTVGTRSTASTINTLLKRVQDTKNDLLRDVTVVRSAMLLLDHGIDAHASITTDAWADTFRNSTGKDAWQELQLVASLIALGAARAVLGDELDEKLDDIVPALRSASETWIRPAKTQTSEQWKYMAKVVDEFLGVLGVDVADADDRLRKEFGHSGLAELVSRRA
ncbi:GmrSD restriction endonuclease domain-containing protein [Cellulomonas septica]|uniref:DUF262 domain-containing protein n=1 Tax=Cellulomonas septica TaxID=285080 RepID=A0ABX1JUY2_9CELL|nr:DUF262 domain-containing protein [Cellulomonas septica]